MKKAILSLAIAVVTMLSFSAVAQCPQSGNCPKTEQCQGKKECKKNCDKKCDKKKECKKKCDKNNNCGKKAGCKKACKK